MRTIVLTIAFLVSSCAHAVSSGTSIEHELPCREPETCVGGSGEADGIVAVAVAGAIVSVLAIAAYQRWGR